MKRLSALVFVLISWTFLFAGGPTTPDSVRTKAIVVKGMNTRPSITVIQKLDTLMDSTHTGNDEEINRICEAFKFRLKVPKTVYSIGIMLKQTGTISNNNSLGEIAVLTDNGGVPGAQISTGVVPIVMYSTLYTDYSFETIVNISYDGLALDTPTSYWLLITTRTAPVDGTVQLLSSAAGIGLYADSSSGTWTIKNSVHGWIRLYGKTNDPINTEVFSSGINSVSYGGTALTGISFDYTSPSISGSHYGGGSGVSGSSFYGSGVVGTSGNGYGVSGVAPEAGGVGGFFVGEGYGVLTHGGIRSFDSVICTELRIADSASEPTRSTGIIGTRYFGVNPDTILGKPKCWLPIKMRLGGDYVDYKIPLY
jgi:hypothetical protein